MQKGKQYKALILDVDGTILPNARGGQPSEKVKETIAKASKKIHVGIATNRPYFLAAPVLDTLKLSGPSVISGGAEVIDATSKKILKEHIIEARDVKKIFQIFNKFHAVMLVNDDGYDIENLETYKPKRPLSIAGKDIPLDKLDEVIASFSSIPTLTVHQIPSWTSGTIVLDITHASASKQYGIFDVAKILNIETSDMIAVGDGLNDFSMLMSAGLKVAMGNAVPELKEIADYIAPTVEEDGVADVIEKFIL